MARGVVVVLLGFSTRLGAMALNDGLVGGCIPRHVVVYPVRGVRCLREDYRSIRCCVWVVLLRVFLVLREGCSVLHVLVLREECSVLHVLVLREECSALHVLVVLREGCSVLRVLVLREECSALHVLVLHVLVLRGTRGATCIADSRTTYVRVCGRFDRLDSGALDR